METPISQEYDFEDIPGSVLWYVRCPTCGEWVYIRYPAIRVMHCSKCCVLFIEGGLDELPDL